MTLGDLLRRFFSGSARSGAQAHPSAAVEHHGFKITPMLRQQGGQYLTCAIIEKDFPEGPRRYELIRADTHSSAEEAKAFAILKARRLIDEQGDRLFG
ncbi:MAG: HlyU family transcriptional regulator [Geminicoccaceae bacterium]|nr:HlyU family transcriptional regulator [Geminicoccaceae bacterium]MCX7629075.1 HlyU family transcriptional regulator [Geminicoccaceae bacterium]MDW8125560.1 HlyU family transcriptional regulator [Geminicoccaceae bacterium]